MADARWAMGQVRAELGQLPLGLIGHSLGGRAALLPVTSRAWEGKHAMLRHGREFDRRAASFTAETLLSRV